MAAISLCLGVLITIIKLNSGEPNATTTTPTKSGPTTVTYPPLNNWGFEVHCKLQPDSYHCDKPENFVMRWYYDIKMEDCKIFKHYSCDSDNRNIFRTYDDCRQFCRDPGNHAIENDLPANAACIMQPDFGDCRDYFPMFYFDMSTRRCLGFAFSGCGGNQNRFYNDKDCQTVCLAATEKLRLPLLNPPTEPQLTFTGLHNIIGND